MHGGYSVLKADEMVLAALAKAITASNVGRWWWPPLDQVMTLFFGCVPQEKSAFVWAVSPPPIELWLCLLQCMLQPTFAVASITLYRYIQASFHWLHLHLWVLNVLGSWLPNHVCRKKRCKSLVNLSDGFGLINLTLHRKPAEAAAGISIDF